MPRDSGGSAGFSWLASVLLVSMLGLGLAACGVAEGRIPLSDRVTDIPSPDGGALSPADGYIPVGGSVSIFDEELPAIAKLDPELRAAAQAAATAAGAQGIEMVVTSGWRSAAYQQTLLDDATLNYGSAEEASKWVSSPEDSRHVTGEAVDIGYTDADSWLSQHGSDYGLCQTYSNEMWHFELAVEPGGVCPEQRANAAE